MLKKVGRLLFSPIRHWRISLTIPITLAIAYKVADQVFLAKLAAQREYPADLQALRPDYMLDIPTDPFTGGPLTYRREGDGFVIYSVGTDRSGDGGKGFDGRNKDVGLCIPESPVVGPK